MIDLLRKLGYVIKITTPDDHESGCDVVVEVNFPKMGLIDKKIPEFQALYLIAGETIFRTINPDGNKKKLVMPKYAMRLYIDLDISYMSRELGLSSKLIVVEDNDGDTTEAIEGIVPMDQLDREVDLMSVFFEAMEENFHKKFDKQAKKLKVLGGYAVLKSLFIG